jgi:hypothetical protein
MSVYTNFKDSFAGVNFSSPAANNQSQTAGYSILNQPVNPVNAPGAALVGGLGENLGSSPVNVNTCNLFGGQSGGAKKRRKRGRKSKRSRKLRKSNKSRLSTKSKKSKSKVRSKVKTVRKSFKKSVKRKSKKSMK